MPESTLKAGPRAGCGQVVGHHVALLRCAGRERELTLSRQSEPRKERSCSRERGRALMKQAEVTQEPFGSEAGQQNRRGRGHNNRKGHNPLARSFESMAGCENPGTPAHIAESI